MEFPQARGKTRPGPQTLEDQILVIQEDLTPARRLCQTWPFGFNIYTAAITQDQPDHMAELMAYQTYCQVQPEILPPFSWKWLGCWVSLMQRWTPAYTHCVSHGRCRGQLPDARLGISCQEKLKEIIEASTENVSGTPTGL